MNIKLLSALVISTMLLSATGCSEAKENPENTPDTTVSATEATEVTEAPTEATEAPTEKPTLAPYTHGEEGYYNTGELVEMQMESQKGGTCWIYAAVANMEAMYELKNGTSIDIDQMEVLEAVYGTKEEGLQAQEGVNKQELGGWTWLLTQTLSNGFNGFCLDKTIVVSDDANPDSSIENIKANIEKYGALTAAIPDRDQSKIGVFNKYVTINHVTDNREDYDHVATILGWDDNFPKEYFKDEASQNGAWICYNSSARNDFYYISYDTKLLSVYAVSATDKYSDVATYDWGNEGDATVKTEGGTVTANKFSKAGKLSAVGTYSHFAEQNITIEVYDYNLNQPIYTQEAVLDGKGYHVVDLDTPIDVTDYAIAIHYADSAPVEGEQFEYDVINYNVKSDVGQSFVLIDGVWCDLADEATQTALNLDFTPNNCCIKGYYTE